MAKITIDLNPIQIKEAFQNLPSKDQIKLTQEFEKITRALRWTPLITKVRSRVEKTPISQKEINLLCREVRT